MTGTIFDPRFNSKVLDDDFVEYYKQNLATKAATHTISIPEIRSGWSTTYRSPWAVNLSGEPGVKDIQLTSTDGHKFVVRCYYPDTANFGQGPYPVHINFHGGGFTFGDLTGDAKLCKAFTQAGVLVLDVDYRLCPENVFGKGHEDGWAAVQWVIDHGIEINAKSDSISIGGISAGAHISAVIQQRARDNNVELKLAVLAVPVVTCFPAITGASEMPGKSYSENEFAPCLNWARVLYFNTHHCPDGANDTAPHLLRNPLNADLHGVCTTMMLTAECDPVRDEGEAYAQKLSQSGVKVISRRYTGVPHPFMHMEPIAKAKLYIKDVCEALKSVHGID